VTTEGLTLRKKMIALATVAILGVLLYFSGFIEGFTSGFEGHPGLPSCGSAHGQSDAKNAIENSPWAKTSGIDVIAINDPKTISANAQKVECTATVLLNSARKGVANYSFTNDPALGSGRYYVRASIDVGSLMPYP
jgi:hypothetical protein